MNVQSLIISNVLLLITEFFQILICVTGYNNDKQETEHIMSIFLLKHNDCKMITFKILIKSSS
jgi:hypothetical protein